MRTKSKQRIEAELLLKSGMSTSEVAKKVGKDAKQVSTWKTMLKLPKAKPAAKTETTTAPTATRTIGYNTTQVDFLKLQNRQLKEMNDKLMRALGLEG